MHLLRVCAILLTSIKKPHIESMQGFFKLKQYYTSSLGFV
jgi:hypothetical protein